MTKCLPLAFLLTLIVAGQLASAHEVRPAYLHIKEQPNSAAPAPAERRYFDILWKQPAVQNGRLAINPVFPPGCSLTDSAPPEVTPSAYMQRWTTQCDLTNGKIHIDGLSMTLTDVMVRIDHANGDSENYILRPESPTLDLSNPNAASLSYLIIGIEHLVFGIDHVLFVVGLVLIIRQPWMLLKTITAFTVAHSITLALSILGWVQIDQGPVEAVIALSILFLARELLQEPSQRSRLTQTSPWIMAFIFGLLHGLGFAGALRDVGLPEDSLWLALLLFNVGIELGQLLIIGALLCLGWIAGRLTQMPAIIRAGAYGMGCLAAFWTIDRTWLLL
jgi:hydrogenase/urease accessory protein HupE